MVDHSRKTDPALKAACRVSQSYLELTHLVVQGDHLLCVFDWLQLGHMGLQGMLLLASEAETAAA